MIGTLTAAPWKLATIGAGVVSLGLAGLLVAAKIENRQLTTLNSTLDDRINHPQTGYVVRLAQAHTNVETLKGEIARQNEAFRELSDADQARLRETEGKLSTALQERAKIQRQVEAFLASPPKGSTLQERVLDVDTRLLEMLK